MEYPWDCKIIIGEKHSHTDGYVCHCDDGHFCEHRAQYLAEWLDKQEKQLINIFEKVEKQKWDDAIHCSCLKHAIWKAKEKLKI